MTILKDKEVTAKKNHHCDAIHFIQNSWDNTMPLHTCNHIRAGDKYRNQVHTDTGDLCDFKMCLPCESYAKEHNIPLNYEG